MTRAVRTVRALPIRRAAIALCAAISVLTSATTAHAGVVKVGACFASDDHRTDAWLPVLTTGEPVTFGDHCGDENLYAVGSLNATASYGFWSTVPTPAPTPSAWPGSVGGYLVVPPVGTTLEAVKLGYRLTATSADWQVRATATTDGGSTVIASCTGPTTATLCADGTTPTAGNSFALPAGTRQFEIAARCVAATTCSYLPGSEPSFSALFTSGEVDVNDPVAPAASAPAAIGTLTPDGSISASGTDTLGIRRLEIVKGSTVIGTAEGTCVDWSLRPCGDPAAGAGPTLTGTFTIRELGLTAGTHVLKTRATDAAGNVTDSAPVSIKLAEPLIAATKLEGGGRSKEPYRQLDWVVPPGMIAAAAAVEMCPVGTPKSCKLLKADVDGPFTFASDVYPDVLARVQLVAPGGGTVFSEPMSFMWDTTAPRQPKLALVEDKGEDRVVEFTADPADDDIARYTARLCSQPGNRCTALPDGELPSTPGRTRVAVKIAEQGAYRLDIELYDAAGNRGLPGQMLLNYRVGPGELKQSDKPLTLVPKLPRKLPKSSLVVKGAVPAGSASKITVTIAGRTTKRKAVKVVKVAKLGTNGAFAVRIKLPAKLNRKQGVLITFAATPAKGWLPVTVRTRLKG